MKADVAEPENPIPLPAGPLGVEMSGVGFVYANVEAIGDRDPSDTTISTQTDSGFALRDIDLCIAAGEKLAVVGSTGSGKSTLAKLIVRAADATTGSVTVGGVPVGAVAGDELRRRVQWVPQEPFLFNDTIANNITIANPAMSAQELGVLLQQLGLGGWVDRFPEGLATNVGERGSLLSAGERQLVALARARAAEPDLIVLDEATSSVDATTEAELADALDALAAGRTSIVIAHRLTTVARSDRVAVVENGRIVEIDTPAALAATPGSRYGAYVQAWERATRGTPPTPASRSASRSAPVDGSTE